MDDPSDSVSVHVTYRGMTDTRFEKKSIWSDQRQLARE